MVGYDLSWGEFKLLIWCSLVCDIKLDVLLIDYICYIYVVIGKFVILY